MPTEAVNTDPTKPAAAKRKKLWLCIRIVDYRLQALAPADPAAPVDDLCWTDIGPDSLVSEDRESVYQLAREHGGLLVAAAGMPNAARLSALITRIKTLEQAAGTSEAF